MFMDRIIGVFKLDVVTFEAIEADESATSQAVIVVLVIARISGLGSALGASFMQASFLGLFASSFFATIIGWLVWSAEDVDGKNCVCHLVSEHPVRTVN